jgi:phosphopantothenoylcysteine decarboxylase/phosphopantothenate--cysteine ligase
MSTPLRILITLGPTQEPIDAVRYIGNRSSGRMGTALVTAALEAGHKVTAVAGPIAASIDPQAMTHRIVTAQQMFDEVVKEFPNHDLLIMAAAVADFRPKTSSTDKLKRGGAMTLELESTPDIVAHVSKAKRPNQRTVGFSLESNDGLARAAEKMRYKSVDLMVYNPLETMNAGEIRPVLLWPDGRSETLQAMPKAEFAKVLIERSAALFV